MTVGLAQLCLGNGTRKQRIRKDGKASVLERGLRYSGGQIDMATTSRKWSAKVKTDSTHPPEGLFTKNPKTIARTLASKRVSPKGPSSGMRMLTFFVNRAGQNLSP